ncbi:hypothetical protein D3C71_110840 [compost metagenome]
MKLIKPFKVSALLKILLTLCLLLASSFWSNSIFAQAIVLQNSSATVNTLSPAQKVIYDKVIALNVFSLLRFVNLDAEALSSPQGVVHTSIGGFPDQLAFKSFKVSYTDPANFEWYGKYFAPTDTVQYSEGLLSLSMHNGRVMGYLQSEQRSFQLYDLGEGLQVLAEYDGNRFSSYHCGVLDEDTGSAPVTQSSCGTNRTRILIVYTPAAWTMEPDPTGKAHSCISDLNRTWTNSEIDNQAELAGIEKVDGLVETNDIFSDRDLFANNTMIQILRASSKADIVVILTRPYQTGSPQGVVIKVGATINQAFALVAVDWATSQNHIFTHEVNHLYGGRHHVDTESGPEYAHAYSFQTGAFLGMGGTIRYTTLRSVAPPEKNIEHISNPDVKYLNKRTGTSSYNNNARRVREFIQTIAGFYNDGTPMQASLSLEGPALCEQSGTATASVRCGTPPYTYQWRYSDNGIYFIPVPGAGNTSSLNTFVPTPYYSTTLGTFNTRHYAVIVTDANGETDWAFATAQYYCPVFNSGQQTISTHLQTTNIYSSALPNPSDGNFTLQITIPEAVSGAQIMLYNSIGQHILTLHNGNLHKGINNITIAQKGKLTSGMYYISIKAGVYQHQQTFIVKP